MELNGKYGKAIVYNDNVENVAISQIINLLNQPFSKDSHVRIMPDVHAGAGCVIGYTAKKTDKIVPNLIGVDIGCGVTAWKLGKIVPMFDKLDSFIRKNIPSGKNIRTSELNVKAIDKAFRSIDNDASISKFNDEVSAICKKAGQSFDYVWNSLGTLGGGNHFIELDKDHDNNLWLIVHCGSRNFGLKVANYHQAIAKKASNKTYTDKEIKKIVGKYKGVNNRGQLIQEEIAALKNSASKAPSGLEFLEGQAAQEYFNDMGVAQLYARLNRRLIGLYIVESFYKASLKDVDIIESVHNYINFEDGIIRKGAISANIGEKVIIPLNMADGVIIGAGKGNEEWNNSAPHGAGRKMSRTKAKESINLESFKKIMKDNGVWSSSVSNSTLDEAPMAYKNAKDILNYLAPTVEVICHMKPVYNFKAGE